MADRPLSIDIRDPPLLKANDLVLLHLRADEKAPVTGRDAHRRGQLPAGDRPARLA